MSKTSIQNKIVERVMKDPTFRKQLMASPKETFEKEFKVKLPAGVTVQVHEEGDDVVHIFVPKEGSKRGADLSDDQLQAAAGGMRPTGEECCCTCGVSTHQTFGTH
jgi:hypothetical protein